MSLIVLCFDRLPTSLLGPYGNTLFSTPAFDDLAASGLTLEFAFRSSCRLHPLLSTLKNSSGVHKLWVPNPKDQSNWLEDELSNRFEMLWQPESLPSISAEESGEQSELPETEDETEVDWTQTDQAKHFSRALEGLEQYLKSESEDAPSGSQDMIWIDMPALSCDWDAPAEWSNRLLGDDEIDLPNDFRPDEVQWSKDWDPDFLAGVHANASAQVMLLDHCMDSFLALTENLPYTLLVTAREGYSFGEHAAVGPASDSCFAEQTQVPMFIRPPGGLLYGVRVPGSQQAENWIQWLANCSEVNSENIVSRSVERFGWTGYSLFASRFQSASDQASPSNSESNNAVRNTAVSFGKAQSGQRQAIVRTDNWSFFWEPETESEKLFVRPDDRMEQNNVASRVPTVLEPFSENVTKLVRAGAGEELMDEGWENLLEAAAGSENDSIHQMDSDSQPIETKGVSEGSRSPASEEESLGNRHQVKEDSETSDGSGELSGDLNPEGGRWAAFPDDLWRPTA